MVTTDLHIETLPNGLVVIVEEMPHFTSISWNLLVTGGLVDDAQGEEGCSLILAELLHRGANGLSSREFSDAVEMLGARCGIGVGTDRFVVSGGCLAGGFGQSFSLCISPARTPLLDPDEIDPIREVLLQDLASLEDNPGRLAAIALSNRYLPSPYNRSPLGTEEGLRRTTPGRLNAMWQDAFRPQGAVLSVAGAVSRGNVLSVVNQALGDWAGSGVTRPPFGVLPAHRYDHIGREDAQVQIALGYPSVKFGDRLYYAAKVASEILSGGMFGRLFIEVREKRGLCYSVHARHQGGRFAGMISAQAGTTPERAQETLDVMQEVLRGLRGTIRTEEIVRAKANLKAALIMGEESPASRAGSHASEWWLMKRVRSLGEILSEVEEVSSDEIEEYLTEFPFASCMGITVGPKPLSFGGGGS